MSKKNISKDLTLLSTHVVETNSQVEYIIKTMHDENMNPVYSIEYAATPALDKSIWNKTLYKIVNTGDGYIVHNKNDKPVKLSDIDYSQFFELASLFRFVTNADATCRGKVRILEYKTVDEYNF
jgi:hypothetical protein